MRRALVLPQCESAMRVTVTLGTTERQKTGDQIGAVFLRKKFVVREQKIISSL